MEEKVYKKKPNEILELESRIDLKFVYRSRMNFLDTSQNSYYVTNDVGNITGLRIYSSPISDPKFLSKFKFLEELIIVLNFASDLTEFNSLTKLKKLDISASRNVDLHFLQKMPKLQYLRAVACGITELYSLTYVRGIRILNLSANSIVSLTPLSKLINIEELSLGHNQITNLQPLSNLSSLTHLSLEYNSIIDISPLGGLHGLNILTLNKNNITDIAVIKNFKNLNLLKLEGNPIEGIPISNLDDINALKGYFESLEQESLDVLEDNYHVKMNIVGSGNIGKTQLFNWFLDTNFSEKRVVTHGANVNVYKVKDEKGKLTPYRASLWDFGGQSYQHGTHSLFLRPKDFYLVLFRNEKDSHNYGYWLGAARSFSSKESDGGFQNPLFLVQNVWSVANDALIYPNSQKIETYKVSPDHFFSLDVKKNFDLEKNDWTHKKEYFQKVLNEKIIAYAKSFGQIPKRFTEIRKSLERRKVVYDKKSAFVEKYASDFTEEHLAYLLQYLEFAGAIIHFREEAFLSDYIFINPYRLSDWIYQDILNEEFLNNNDGILDLTNLETDIGKEKTKIFTALMNKFNLSFVAPKIEGEEHEGDHLVIPQFLPEKNNVFKDVILDLIPYTFSIRFEDYIYEGRIINFISKHGKEAKDNSSYWKYGILFNYHGTNTIVNYESEERTIHVHIEDKNQAFDLLVEILEFFITKSNSNLDDSEGSKLKKAVKHPESKTLQIDNIIEGTQLSVNNENYFDIISALKLKKSNVKIVNCTRTNKPILLDVFTLKLLGMEDKRLKKVFISYSRKDIKYLDQLKSHLSLLDRYDLIKTWTCEQINTGKWHRQIQDELEEADIIVYMVSHNFLDSNYIMEEEVQKGIQLAQDNPEKKILCVLVGSCQWKNLSELEEKHNELSGKKEKYSKDLTQFQFLPYHQYKDDKGDTTKEEIVPIEKWGRHPYDVANEAYNQVAERIMREIR